MPPEAPQPPTLDRTTAPNPRSHRSRRTPAPLRSHPSTAEIVPPEAPQRLHPNICKIVPPEAPSRSRHLKHHWDRTLALARSHPWPTHARSLSFSIYLSLSLNCQSLSLLPSLRLTEFLSLMNVLFWFLFGFVLIFVCFKFIYWNFLLWNLFGSWENVKNL